MTDRPLFEGRMLEMLRAAHPMMRALWQPRLIEAVRSRGLGLMVSGGDSAFALDLEVTDRSRRFHVGATTEFHGIAVEGARLAANLARSLINVEDDAIVAAQLRHFEQADPEYAKRVELALAALQR